MNAFGKLFGQEVLGAVTNSIEFQRILALPRRVLDLDSVEASDDTLAVTEYFAKSGELSFWPIQARALIEAALADGLFALIGVGHGKTLIGLALPEALDSKKAVYLVKPDLKRQLVREASGFYGRHFNLPLDRIEIVSYTELSAANTASILEKIDPDLIVADEAHCLRHKESARTDRFLRFAKEHTQCRYAFLSGTMTTRSIMDYAHLIELALRKNSPLPRGYRELKDWSGALDVKPEYFMAPGYLKHFCHGGESARDGFRRRLVETQGVVATEEGALGTSLVFNKCSLRIPSKIATLMQGVRKNWSLEGEEFSEATAVSRALKQLACGFYYRWVWPEDEPDYEWLDARRAWNSEVRQRLKHSSEGFDSPFLLAQAAERYRKWEQRGKPRPYRIRGDIVLIPNGDGKPSKAWVSSSWESWLEVKDREPPPVQAVWVSDFLVDAAIEWAKKQKQPCIIWYEWKALGERIASKGELPLYDAGTDASESNDHVIVASIRTQGTGKNLQRFSRNLCTSLPPNGTLVEQLAGRTHRPGQGADEVIIDWFGHTPETEEAMSSVLGDAEYTERTTGQRQKVLYAVRK